MIKPIMIQITLIFLLLTISGCAKKVDEVVINQNSTVIAFGDSLTTGFGVPPEHSYPSVLQEHLGVTVINEGVSGEVSSKGLARLDSVLRGNFPDLVILCHGGNDILRKMSRQQLKQNLADMIELIQSYDAQIILVGVPEPSFSLESLPVYAELAEEYNLVLDAEILPELLGDPSMKSDKIHLNMAGYKAMALAISQKIWVN